MFSHLGNWFTECYVFFLADLFSIWIHQECHKNCANKVFLQTFCDKNILVCIYLKNHKIFPFVACFRTILKILKWCKLLLYSFTLLLNSCMLRSLGAFARHGHKKAFLDCNTPDFFFPSATWSILAKSTSVEISVAWPLFLDIRHLMNFLGNVTEGETCRPSSRKPLWHAAVHINRSVKPQLGKYLPWDQLFYRKKKKKNM